MGVSRSAGALGGLLVRDASHTSFRAGAAMSKCRGASVFHPEFKVEKGACHAYFLSCAALGP
jgi:hypothetical protein